MEAIPTGAELYSVDEERDRAPRIWVRGGKKVRDLMNPSLVSLVECPKNFFCGIRPDDHSPHFLSESCSSTKPSYQGVNRF